VEQKTPERPVEFKTQENPSGPPEKRLGCLGAFLVFLYWGFFGFWLGTGLVFYLLKAWKEVPGADMGDIPAGIMVGGSLAGLVAIVLCGLLGVFMRLIRGRQWGTRPATFAGLLGPALGTVGCIAGGVPFKSPTGWFIGALAGLVLGINLGRRLGAREKAR
jgi:hypothetical protein